MGHVIAILICLVIVMGCKTTEDRGSDPKAIYKMGISSGEAIGPVLDAAGNMTLMLCESLDQYETLFKNVSGTDSQTWGQSKCRPLGGGSGVQLVKPIWIAKKDVPKFKNKINDSLWKRCLQDQFWFCDDAKINKEVEAAFSPGKHLGRFINGSDWIKLFWETANREAQSFQTL